MNGNPGEFLFPLPGNETRRLLEGLPGLINRAFPLPGRFRGSLARDVAELSRLLTGARGERRQGYLNSPPMLSAYLRYFLPWNVYRLSRLLPALPLSLNDGDTITDLGSGPFTLAASLWIARPDLREKRLHFRCADRSGPVLEAGKKLFAALVPAGSPWTARAIRADFHECRIAAGDALVSAVNVYNELAGDISPADRGGLERRAEGEARFLTALAPPGAALFIAEPGTPQSAAFLAELRGALIRRSRKVGAPCPHGEDCPFPGGREEGQKRKWCHFAFETDYAPESLRRLSSAAGIPKERAVSSFLFFPGAGREREKAAGGRFAVRILSDAFPVGTGSRFQPENSGEWGRYGCSARGAVLVAGEKRGIEALPPGTLMDLPPPGRELRDAKSGALRIPLLPHDQGI